MRLFHYTVLCFTTLYLRVNPVFCRYHQQGGEALERGMSRELRDRLLRSYVINNYEAHLREVLLAVENEYWEWDEVGW